MKITHSLVLALVFGAVGTLNTANAQDHHMGCAHGAAPTPLLTVGDFDGSGVVDGADVNAVARRIPSKEGDSSYHPLYDRNADGVLDNTDVVLTSADVGAAVPKRDQQIAEVTQATMKYYVGGISAALRDGFLPFTSELNGHGIHFVNFNRMLAANAGPGDAPAYDSIHGLNFTPDGKLVAIFWADTLPRDPNNPFAVDPAYDHPPANTFDGLMAHTWHNHVQVVFQHLGSLNWQDIHFAQNLTLQEVFARILNPDGTVKTMFPNSGLLYSPKFNMLHLWSHSLNPCGMFNMTNPLVSADAPSDGH